MPSSTQIGAFLLVQMIGCVCAFLLARVARTRLFRNGNLGRYDHKDWQHALLVFTVCALAYMGSTPGATTTSDEDLLALVRAISRGATLEITQYTRSVHDSAFREGRFFSHKPPGTAVVALPFYNLPRLLRPVLLPLNAVRNVRIIQTADGRFTVDRPPGPSTYVTECRAAPSLTKITLVVYETFARPANFVLSEVSVYGPDSTSVPLRVDTTSEIEGARPPRETVDGNTGEDMVHGWPGAAKASEFPVHITWRLDRPVAPSRIALAQLSPYRDHLIRSFELTGEDIEGKEYRLQASGTHIESSIVDWCEKGACSSVALVSAVGVALLFGLLRAFEIRRDLAVGLALLFAFATLQWRYASVLYNHSLLTTSTLGALLGLLCVLRRPDKQSGWWILGCSLAWGMLADSIAFLAVGVSIVAVVPMIRQAGWKNRAAVVLPIACGLGILGLYQWLCFSSPLGFPQQYSYRHGWLRSFSTAFDFPVLKGLWILLLHRGPLDGLVSQSPWIYADLSRPFSGLFVASPYLIFAFLGLGDFYRKETRFAVCSLIIVMSTILVMASFRTPWGGGDYDVRYIHHVVPVLFLPLGIWANNLLRYRRALRIGLALPLAATTWIGLTVNWRHLADGPGRENLVVTLAGGEWAHLVPPLPCFPAWPIILLVGPPLVLFVIVIGRPMSARSP
jgi:hypothetical protein